jgi:hypothetical protein
MSRPNKLDYGMVRPLATRKCFTTFENWYSGIDARLSLLYKIHHYLVVFSIEEFVTLHAWPSPVLEVTHSLITLQKSTMNIKYYKIGTICQAVK